MEIFELTLFFAGITLIFIIGYGLFLMKPYSKPIVEEATIVEKYTLSEVKCYAVAFPGGSTSMPVTIPTYHIVVLSEKGHETKIRVGKEKYDTLEVDDSIEITEYSRTKMIVEKKRNLRPRNEEI